VSASKKKAANSANQPGPIASVLRQASAPSATAFATPGHSRDVLTTDAIPAVQQQTAMDYPDFANTDVWGQHFNTTDRFDYSTMDELAYTMTPFSDGNDTSRALDNLLSPPELNGSLLPLVAPSSASVVSEADQVSRASSNDDTELTFTLARYERYREGFRVGLDGSSGLLGFGQHMRFGMPEPEVALSTLEQTTQHEVRPMSNGYV